jgi:type I restriction enzyme, S subunit
MELKQGYKQTEVGVIPEDWVINYLNKVAVITRLAGYEYSTMWEESPNGEIIALRGFNIGQNKIIEREYVRISNELSMKLKRSRLYKGDVIYPCVGTIGNAVVIEEDDKFHIQQNIAKITPIQKIIDSKFLAYYLMSSLGLNEINKFNGTSSQPNILVGSLRQYSIILPPLPEQTAIANVLSDMDALISQTEKLIEKKKAIKQGAMQELLKPKEGWATKKLGDVILSFQNGNAFSAVGYVKNGTPIVTMAQIGLDGAFNFNESKVNRWVLSDFNFLKSYHLKNGDLIMAMTDVTPEKNLIGRMALVKTKETLLLNQRVGLLRIDSSKTNAYFLKTISNMKEWRSYCIGIASLGVQANIGTKDILNGEILMPDVIVQDEIAEILTTMDNELSQIQHKLTKLKQQKQGMMQALLTGKIRLIS